MDRFLLGKNGPSFEYSGFESVYSYSETNESLRDFRNTTPSTTFITHPCFTRSFNQILQKLASRLSNDYFTLSRSIHSQARVKVQAQGLGNYEVHSASSTYSYSYQRNTLLLAFGQNSSLFQAITYLFKSVYKFSAYTTFVPIFKENDYHYAPSRWIWLVTSGAIYNFTSQSCSSSRRLKP